MAEDPGVGIPVLNRAIADMMSDYVLQDRATVTLIEDCRKGEPIAMGGLVSASAERVAHALTIAKNVASSTHEAFWVCNGERGYHWLLCFQDDAKEKVLSRVCHSKAMLHLWHLKHALHNGSVAHTENEANAAAPTAKATADEAASTLKKKLASLVVIFSRRFDGCSRGL